MPGRDGLCFATAHFFFRGPDGQKERIMKKTQPALQRQPRRLSLNRETIRSLDAPALLELARGGKIFSGIDSCETITNQESIRC
jgi:hypothetical protein